MRGRRSIDSILEPGDASGGLVSDSVVSGWSEWICKVEVVSAENGGSQLSNGVGLEEG